MKLRPHHLLCTQGYSGKGYSNAFVANMTVITSRLRGEENVEFDLVFSTDDLCEKCPKMLGPDLCKDQDQVKGFDSKVVSYFGLEERRYRYRDIVREINEKITREILEDICGGCGWYPVSACRRNILGV